MSIFKADIVKSEAGRDAGRLFYVLSADDTFLLLADGKVRKVEHPKRKKIRHVSFVARPDSAVADQIRSDMHVQNSELRRDLARWKVQLGSQNQGGL